MKKSIYLMTTIGLLNILPSMGQTTISAEVRPRTEFRNGFKTLTNEINEPAVFTEQRSRINLDYLSSDINVRVSFQDIRIWGESPQIFKEELGKSFISEAWGRYYFRPEISFKVGRQIISYDNERILGGLEWAQQGRRHDAALLMYEAEEKKFRLHIGLAFNQDNEIPEPAFLQSPGASFYSVNGNYKNMQYGWFNRTTENGSLSILAMNTGYQNPDSTLSYRQTTGFTGQTNLSGFKIGGDFYYQSGKQGDRKISALLAGVNATYKTSLTPLTLGVEHLSGDNDPSGDLITHFSPDFGTNHAHNGFMDYFYVGPQNGTVGVTDLYLKTSFSVAGGDLKVNAHEFFTGSPQQNREGTRLESAMGTEIDLVYIKKLKGGVVWHLGYSQMFATETMESLRGGDRGVVQNWAWTMVTFTPTLFTSE